MALRVLLADESSTIKKVMQLALQDYGVEVKSVPVGLDVLPITKEYNPDIIFIDVLLSKRSGYEVSQEIKSDSITQKSPVVLMWSGFMEMDENNFRNSKADEKLEKPFDAETLRDIVQKLVMKTRTNALSSMLKFPDLPQFSEEQAQPKNHAELQKHVRSHFEKSETTSAISPTYESFKMDSQSEDNAFELPALPDAEIEEIDLGEEFSQVPLHLNTDKKEKQLKSPLDDSWSQQDISKFRIESSINDESDFGKKYMIPQNDEIDKTVLYTQELSPDQADSLQIEELQEIPLTKPPQKKVDVAKAAASTIVHANNLVNEKLKSAGLDPEAERILREEARSVLEGIAWKLVPDIAERIIREEIQKLLRETEKNI